MNIEYDNRQDEISIGEEQLQLIEKSIGAVLRHENLNDDVEVSLSFVNDLEMKELNYSYRGVDRTTDVLSFPLEDEFCLANRILGDIVINTRKVMEQATEFGHSKDRELSYLTVHSTLHLLGYDHIKDEDRVVMRAKEKEIMKELQLDREGSDETR
ncbi:MAG: rRNA maturation RNase YbeY [Tissierellia bacterium]|nr:rRNA maturation RNase YbeY [Tissierellia bacterium]